MTVFRPILFNTEMVRAILEGRKTKTRRLLKIQPEYGEEIRIRKNKDGKLVGWFYCESPMLNPTIPSPWGGPEQEPPCQPGDVLWVRETWCNLPVSPGGNTRLMRGRYYYKADDPDTRPDGWKAKWRPSIHMPKEAARLFLRVTDIRAERLQDITDADALKEGVPQDDDFPMNSVYCPVCHGEGLHGALHPATLGYMEVDCENCDTPVKRFSHLWDSMIKYDDMPRLGWEANPWVWVIEFERVQKPAEWEEYLL